MFTLISIVPKIKYKLHYGWCTERRFTAATLHNTICSEGKWGYWLHFCSVAASICFWSVPFNTFLCHCHAIVALYFESCRWILHVRSSILIIESCCQPTDVYILHSFLIFLNPLPRRCDLWLWAFINILDRFSLAKMQYRNDNEKTKLFLRWKTMHLILYYQRHFAILLYVEAILEFC